MATFKNNFQLKKMVSGMHISCVILIVSLLLISVGGFSQTANINIQKENISTVATEVRKPDRYISGRITDAADGEPIPSATVFFTNTTVGITTDLEGNYRLRIPGEGSYSLTVSHVGYQSVVKVIEPGATSMVFNVAMKTQELDDVVVSAGIRFRRNDINLFWRTILGKNPSQKTIQATNPETVYYYYNSATRILKVICREPLQIVNYETGYQIQYILENFTHNYNTGITDWSHKYVFTELEPENPKQKNSWEENRRKVYNVSLIKFIKSLYNNTLQKDGFLLADLRLNPDPSNPFSLTMLTQDHILSTAAADNGKSLNLSNRQILLICYGKPVAEVDLIRLERSQFSAGRYNSGFDMGSGRSVSMSYTPGYHLGKNGLYRSMLQGQSIRIFPDGTFTNELTMASVNDASSSPLMGLSMKLPIDYNPEGSTFLAIEVTADKNKSKFDDIPKYFETQLSTFPQEKIHLHTDRDMYISGEKIWFKAYVTDALTHQYPTQSRYVYVELISPADTLVQRVMVRPVDDMFYGNLPLTEYVPTGNYTLRAYTRYMENLGDDYFFKKNIRIENIDGGNEGNEESRGRNSANRKNSTVPTNLRTQNDFEVSFFPEGGNLPEGVMSKVAFKALNINGYPEKITGWLVDEKGVKITSVETVHAGMGVVEYMPEMRKRFFLKCKYANGLEKQFELPQPDRRAFALTVSQHNQRISVGIRKSPRNPNSPLYLLAQCRGEVRYFSEWDHEKENILFDEEEFPAGIVQFVLFDERMNPLSERLVFNKNYDEAVIEFQTDKMSYTKRDKVNATLTMPSSLIGKTGEGSFSIAITDDKDFAVDSSTTILSSLLLSSELRGYIENPTWYLQDNAVSATALDYLMMTHGWRRYSIPDVVKGTAKQPQIPFQTSQMITGKIKSPSRLRSVAGSEVVVLLEDGNFGLTATDTEGKFLFQDFEYPDSTTYFLRVLNNMGNSRIELVVDEETFPKLIHAIQSPVIIEPDNDPSLPTNDFIEKAEQRARYDEDMWMIQLGEIEVTATRIEKKTEPRLEFWANASSDATIGRDEIRKKAYLKVTDYLKSVPGVRVLIDPYDPTKTYINIRGAASLTLDTQPLILVDGIALNSDINDLRFDEIESIDVFKGVSTAAFGAQGSSGIISITTDKGGGNNNLKMEESKYTVYTPLGYQKPVEFYAPKYETMESKFLTIPDFRTTIFWKPDIVISEDEEEATFEFYTSDFPTTYSVVIEGLTSDGRIIRQVEKIRIE